MRTCTSLPCIIFLAVLSCLHAGEPKNVLANGGFQAEGGAGGADGWSRGDPALISFPSEGTNRFCRINLPKPKAAIIQQKIKLDPGWKMLDISVRVRAKDVKPGSQGWMTGQFQGMFFDANGQKIKQGRKQLLVSGDIPEWTTLEAKELTVPQDAAVYQAQIGVWGASGVFDFDDVKVMAQTADLDPVSGAEILSATRSSMDLNGRWQFLPGTGSAAKKPTDDWGQIKVPGNWHEDVITRGNSDAWTVFKPKETNKAWYRREVEIPADWQGRAAVLKLRRVSTDAMVTVNGQKAGEVKWPGGHVDITKQIQPGKTNEIIVMVLAMNDRTSVTRFMGYVDEPTMKAELNSRGIIGTVELLARPKGAHIVDLGVVPSVRKKKLFLNIELAHIQHAGEVIFKAAMHDESGKVETTLTGTARAEAKDYQVVQVAFDWPDPRLWDYKQPNLYTMHLSATGAGLNDEYVQNFGFREFWIEGRKFFLNGSEIRLRPESVSSQYKGTSNELIEKGTNYAHRWPWDQVRRGIVSDYDLADIERTDKAGLLCDANLAHMSWYLGNWQNPDNWNKPGIKEEYFRILNQQVRLYRNHPSVVMYTTTANALACWGDSDPWDVGVKDPAYTQGYYAKREQVFEIMEQVKQIDPKPIFAHHGGDNGDVYTSNTYLNFLPLQEREEWISYWTKEGDMPYMVVEFGAPLYASVMRGRAGYAHQGTSEPMPSEWAAAHFGKQGYTWESPELRELLAERFKGGDLQKEYQPHIRWDKKEEIIKDKTGFKQMLELYIINTWRSWRTMGITGGMVAWGGNDEVLKKVNGESLAWIAGPGGIPDQKINAEKVLTEKTHHYTPGQTLEKQLALINDYRGPTAFTATYEIKLGDETLLKKDLNGTLKVTEIRLIPISVKLPVVNGIRRGSIALTATIGEEKHEHTLEFDVIPPASQPKLTLSVFDPNGTTSKYLKSLGYTVEPWTEGQPNQSTALVGRHALSDGNQIPGDPAAWVRGGGRLLIMGQESFWTDDALHLRTAPYLTRRVFRVDDAHPIVAGFDDSNLCDWNGSSTTVDGYTNYKGLDWVPALGWRWGNRHAVSSTPIEKPHRSSWRPILECEFDLAYTPLMEMDYGKGRLTFCTLDVEGRTDSDPVAETIFGRLMQHVATASLPGKAQEVVFIGNSSKALDDLGVHYSKANAPGGELTIIGAGANIADAALRSYVEGGGKVLVLHRDGESAPFGVKLAKTNGYFGSLNPPSWPEAAGLSASDLRWRGNWDAWLLQPADGLEVGADGQLARMAIGKGVVIFAQISPDAVPAEQKRYFRFTRWRQTRALSQVLANLGASFRQDDKMLALLKTPDHYINLAGHDWKAALTNPVPEPVGRATNHVKFSDKARSLVQPDASLQEFQDVWVPAYMEAYGEKWRWVNGEAVFRKAIQWPAHAAGKPAFISVGRVDERETTFINGQEVGSSDDWVAPRGHKIPANLLKAGENIIALRVSDANKHGGVCGSPSQIFIRVMGEDPGFYHSDYISDDVPMVGEDKSAWKKQKELWSIADNPYRYYRW